MDGIVDALPPLQSLYVYGPLGFVFASVLLVALDHYWTVRRPYAKKKAALELEIQAEQREYTVAAKQVIARLAESSERTADRLNEHDKKLDYISQEVAGVKVTLDGFTKHHDCMKVRHESKSQL